MKCILVTGIRSAIGEAVAQLFREHNYYVYGIDKEEEGYGAHVDRFIHFDLHQFVRDVEYRIRTSEELERLIPNLDVLVNNAEVQKLDRLKDIKLDDWQETLNVNLTGPMLLSKLFLDQLEASKGCIINIASIHHLLTRPAHLTYATSKNALVGLTKAMAVDLEGRVRVNAISPATADSPGLPGMAEEVGRLAFFLASASEGHINGINISLDSGISSTL
ncbi:MAG: SDR family oxidoreductase [Lewinellaceae bacterium]|nr:SDR family oxidoreductase [Lewinellaceae bacterium]